MEIENLKIAMTSAAEEEIDEMKEILLDIQNKSDTIFQNYYDEKLKGYICQLQSYLKKQMSLPDTNLIQIQEDKKSLEEKIAEIQKNLKEEKESFAFQADHSIDVIRSKVDSELRKNTSVFENIIMQGGSIQEKINTIVRSSITAGIREQLEPKLQRYISNVSDMINMGDIMLDSKLPLLNKGEMEDNEAKRSALQSAVTPVATVIATVVGSMLGGPIGTVIGAIAGAFLGSAVNQYSRQKEEAQKQEAASNRVRQILDEVMATVKPQIEETVRNMTERVNQDIDAAFSAQIEMKQKELNDLESNLVQGKQEQQKKLANYQADLDCLLKIAD